MIVIKVLEYVFIVIFFVFGVYSTVIIQKFKRNESRVREENCINKDDENNNHAIVETIQLVLSLVLFVIVFFYTAKLRILGGLFLVIALISFGKIFYGAQFSMGGVGDIISSDEEGELDVYERYSIFLLSDIMLVLIILELFSNLFTRLLKTIQDGIDGYLGDIVYIAVYCAVAYVLLFLIISMISDVILILYKFLLFFGKKIKQSGAVSKVYCFFVKSTRSNYGFNTILGKIIEHNKDSKKILVRVVYPFVFIIDIPLLSLRLFLTVMREGIGYLLMMVKNMGSFFVSIFGRFSSLSHRSVIKVALRLSLIIAIVLTVVMNRAFPIYKVSSNVTSIVEFVGSAIVIPAIFESLYYFRFRKSKRGII